MYFWLDWSSNSIRYSTLSFFFFWRFFSKKIKFKKNFQFPIFTMKIFKILMSDRHKFFKKKLELFFCFFFVSQTSFDNLKPDDVFLKIFFFLFRNIFPKKKILNYNFIDLFTITVLFLPNGFSLDSTFLYVLISKFLFYLPLKILKKKSFLGKILTKFQKNRNKYDIVTVFFLKIFIKDFIDSLTNNFFLNGMIDNTSVGSIIKKNGKNDSLYMKIVKKKFTRRDLLRLNVRFFWLIISFKKRKKINLIKKIPFLNLNNEKSRKIFFSIRHLIYLTVFFKLHLSLKKKKYKKKKFYDKKFAKYFIPLNFSFLISNFFSVNFLKKKEFLSDHLIYIVVFSIWHDYQISELYIKQHIKSSYKKNDCLKKLQNLFFELMCDKMARKKKFKKNQRWNFKNIEKCIGILNYIKNWKINRIESRRNLLILYFEFILYDTSLSNHLVYRFFFPLFNFFLQKIHSYFFWVFKICTWKNNTTDFYFLVKKLNFSENFSVRQSNKILKSSTLFQKENYRFEFLKKFDFEFSFYFSSNKKIQQWIEKNPKQNNKSKWILFYFMNRKYLKRKTEKILEEHFLLFLLSNNEKNFFSNFPKLISFLKKLLYRQRKKVFSNLNKSITQIILFCAMFSHIFFQKCHFCLIFWNFSPKIYYFFVESLDKKFLSLKDKKKKILTIFFFSAVLIFIQFKKSSKIIFSTFYEHFFLKKKFLILKKNFIAINSKLLNKKKENVPNMSHFFFFFGKERNKKNKPLK